MTNRHLLCALVLTMLLSGCLANAEQDAPSVSTQTTHTLVHDGKTREYILFVPGSYDETSRVPLVLNFHGFGGRASEFLTYADLRPLAESERFILVYPQGSTLNGQPHWNASLPSPDNKSDADDLGFFDALIDELFAKYTIDAERIYAFGYSNGAMFSYALACYRSELIAAIGSVSGTMLDGDCRPNHPIPVISIHGTGDDVLPYNGNEHYASVESILDFWTSRNHTNPTPIVNSFNDSGTTIEHYQFTGGDSGVSVEHYKVIDGGHVWFHLTYQGANTNELLWNFVARYEQNGVR